MRVIGPTLPTHPHLIPRPFATFPEAAARLADEDVPAEAAVFGAVGLFAGAEAAANKIWLE